MHQPAPKPIFIKNLHWLYFKKKSTALGFIKSHVLSLFYLYLYVLLHGSKCATLAPVNIFLPRKQSRLQCGQMYLKNFLYRFYAPLCILNPAAEKGKRKKIKKEEKQNETKQKSRLLSFHSPLTPKHSNQHQRGGEIQSG